MNENAGLFAKMVRVMDSMKRIPKRGHNSHFNYDFVTDGDVLDAVRAAMVEQGIALFVSFSEAERRDGKITVGKFTLTFADSETGQTHDVQWIGEGQDTQDKGAAKAATSAVKYALLKTFMISTGDAADDPDSGGITTSTAHPAGKRPQQPPDPLGNGDEPPQDMWDREEQGENDGALDLPSLDIVEVGTFVSQSGKAHVGLMSAGHKWPDIRWWGGRDALIQSAPWLSESCTKDALGVEDARFPFQARVYYRMDGKYKVAERFERLQA